MMLSDSAHGDLLRTRQVRAAIAAALAIPLLLGGVFLLVDRFHSSPDDYLDNPANPINDDQAQAQVVEPAKQIVSVAGLHTTSAGYLLMSCRNRADPPYQGAIYLTFALPAGVRADVYLGKTAAVLASHGWAEGLPPSTDAFGKTLSKDDVTAIISRHGDDDRLGVLRLYGQCRNTSDHRNDTTAWSDITGQLTPTR